MKKIILSALTLIVCTRLAQASEGTAGASFLDIPVGAAPASMGGAYTAQANDAYAPTWNPAGLGFLESNQLAGQHLSYLDSIHYEYLSFVHPLEKGSGIGASMQYLGTGDITATDNVGNNVGSFSAHYASYNLAYGRTVSDKLSLGVTGKLVNAAIDDVSANAFAADLGAMYRYDKKVTLAAVVSNMGTQLKFLSEGNSLPLAAKVGGTYQIKPQWMVAAEGVYSPSGLTGFHIGTQWNPMQPVALRLGYKTDTLAGLSPIAGLTLGLGLNVWGQEFAYAWVPYGDLGNTQYFSLVIRFGESPKVRMAREHIAIVYHKQKAEPTYDGQNSEDDQLTQILDQGTNDHLSQAPKSDKKDSE